MRMIRVFGLMISTYLVFTSSAHATSKDQPFQHRLAEKVEPSPSFAFEGSVGWLSPQIGAKAARAYHRNQFGSAGGMVWTVGATRYFPAAWQPDPLWGSFGMQLRAGMWKTSNSVQAGTSIQLVPISLSMIWRLPQLRDLYSIPIVGFVNVGADVYYWEGRGAYREGTTKSSTGFQPGMHASFVLGVDLLHMGTHRRHAQKAVILAFETGYSWLHGFGESKNALDWSNVITRANLIMDL